MEYLVMRAYGAFFPLTTVVAFGAFLSSGVMNPIGRLGVSGGSAGVTLSANSRSASNTCLS